jgi:hypothetical protein
VKTRGKKALLTKQGGLEGLIDPCHLAPNDQAV